MRFSLFSLARLGIGAVVVSSAAAIGLARIAPEPRGWRISAPVRYASVNAFYLNSCQRGSIWADRDGGPPITLSFRDDELLEYASLSPWLDEQGRTQAVGRWAGGFQSNHPEMAFGLARVGFPDGEVLDHVETEVVPVSSPCWYPGTRARVLFAAGDGRLYHHSFERANPASSLPAQGQAQPQPIAWDCEVPNGGDIYLSDPTWPTDPEFARLILVVLRRMEKVGGRSKSTPTQVWWLRLNEAGTSIERAGPLFAPSGDGAEINERCPTVGQGSDGRRLLGYLRQSGLRTWALCIAELPIDPARGVPLPLSGPGRPVAEGLRSTSPIFSSDGHWVSAVQETGASEAVVRRFRVDLGPGSGINPASPGRTEAY